MGNFTLGTWIAIIGAVFAAAMAGVGSEIGVGTSFHGGETFSAYHDNSHISSRALFDKFLI